MKVGSQALFTILLARIIAPSTFGNFAIAIAVIAGFEVLREFGLHHSTLHNGHIGPRQRITLFWIRLYRGVIYFLALLTFISILNLYEIPNAIIQNLLILSPILIFNSLQNFFYTIAIIDSNFKNYFWTEMVSFLLSNFFVLLLVLRGYERIALPIGILLISITLLVTKWSATKFLLKFEFDKNFGDKLFESGKYFGLSSILHYLSKNVDTAILSFTTSGYSLGLYNRAFQLVEVPIQEVLKSTGDQFLGKASSSDLNLNRSPNNIFKSSLALGAPLIFALIFLIINSETFISNILGQKWIPMTRILQLIALGAVFQVFLIFSSWMYFSKKIEKNFFNFSAISTFIRVLSLAFGSLSGAIGASMGYAVGFFFQYSYFYIVWRKALKTYMVRYITIQFGVVMLAIASSIPGYLYITKLQNPKILHLILEFLVSVAIFFLSLKMLRNRIYSVLRSSRREELY